MPAPLQSTIFNLQSSFKSWLVSKNYSSSTIRNYLADLNKYLNSCSSLRSTTCPSDRRVYDPQSLSSYLTSVSNDPNYPRYLSSLNKFFQFSLDQKLINTNPLKKIKKCTGDSCLPAMVGGRPQSLENLISQYKSHLIKKKYTPVTIKNYINDIQQYISFLENKKINESSWV